jgi:hypothetical protein
LGFDDTRTLMRELDRDGDGRMNYREFVQFLKSSGSSSGGGIGGDKDVDGRRGRGDSAERKSDGAAKTPVNAPRALTSLPSPRTGAALKQKFDAGVKRVPA